MQKTTYTGFELSWSDLQFFLVAARSGSAAEAARRLNIDQATVSRRVRRLEAQLGQPLLVRGPQGHALTQAGEALLARAEIIEGDTFAILDHFPTARSLSTQRCGLPGRKASSVLISPRA
ncbi:MULTISPECIES: LysR family transcriptional regulator [unclassified Chelatococcus]|uniref:LysR family transcriptional regulator n=1 Tax=unclassified Chelatococcus TaxID=2638111 RepID=UPI001BCC6995|nr:MULTISPECIES: LysR family transcriptional regulator [unclassified Chelatococcus]MBS7700739.1 LysR family transcriptional regulator [Chelatococcus sp. YT9]MBX3559323.1 LysR family transcriptional regulator [Chelatococcus sp.]